MGHVTGAVPAGFDASVRVLHPIEGDDGRSIRWSEVADEAGTRIHPLAQWRHVARSVRGERPWWHDTAPEERTSQRQPCSDYCPCSNHHTTTPQDGWFCLWNRVRLDPRQPSIGMVLVDNDGSVTERDVPAAYPDDSLDPVREVKHPGREYLLGRGPLDSALSIGRQISDDWFDAAITHPVLASGSGVVRRHRNRLRLHLGRRLPPAHRGPNVHT